MTPSNDSNGVAVKQWFDQHIDECRREGICVDHYFNDIGKDRLAEINFQSPNLIALIEVWSRPMNIDLTIERVGGDVDSRLEVYSYVDIEDACLKLSECLGEIFRFHRKLKEK